MSKNDENDDKTDSDEAQIWRAAMQDVEPLKDKNTHIKHKDAVKKPVNPSRLPQKSRNSSQNAAYMPEMSKKQGNDVDHKTLSRFTSGKMPIEARLDLHHMNQDAAHSALRDFILSSHGAGKRCLLVITGKGEREKGEKEKGAREKGKLRNDSDWLAPEAGILRKRVPDWLEDAPLAPFILKTAPAQPKDGGSGALYILLRRQR